MVLSEHYSASFRLIDGQIIMTIPCGYSEGGGMEEFLKKREAFLQFVGLVDTPYVELKDYRLLTGKINRKDRITFTKYLLEEIDKGFMKGLFIYNGSTILKWTYEMGKRIYSKSFPFHYCKGYDQALILARNILNKSEDSFTQEDETESDKEIEKLFYFISSMNWDLSINEEMISAIDDANPYKKIYQALALFKTDFDSILTKQKKAEEAMHNANREIEKKVEERTRLLREERTKMETSLDILSHDTKNHFIGLKYDSNQIEDGKLKSSIGDSIREIEELISEATGIMSSKRRIFSIVELVENIRVTEKRIPLPVHDRIRVTFISPEFLFVNTTALFKNALSNLIENALKYTGHGNPVKIIVEKNENVLIHIIDYGKGIPDDEKKKILEKFYRREEDAPTIEGSGRGLWITNNIIKQEGGSLTIHDNPEGGTVFTISMEPYRVDDLGQMLEEMSVWFQIPLDIIRSRSEAFRTLYTLQGRKDIEHMDSAVFTSLLTEIRRERKEEKKASVNQRLELFKNQHPGGKSIIIVDDSLYVQHYLARYFFELGYNILDYADNGESAVISYKKHKPDFISLDNNMNIMTGPEAAVEISQFDSQCRIIFISALGDSKHFREQLEESLPHLNYRILTKPIYKKDVEKILDSF